MDIFAERRKQVVDDAAAAGFDLGGDGHAGGDRLGAAIDQERRAVERDVRDIGRRGIPLPGAGFAPRGALVAENAIAAAPPAGRHRTQADINDMAGEQPVAGERKRLHLDLRRLPGMHEADIAVLHHRLDQNRRAALM